MTRYCTMPDLLHIRHWFEKNYGGCCGEHDNAYSKHSLYTRLEADNALFVCMVKAIQSKDWFSRWFKYFPFCVATYAFVRAFGWLYYKKR